MFLQMRATTLTTLMAADRARSGQSTTYDVNILNFQSEHDDIPDAISNDRTTLKHYTHKDIPSS